MKQLLTNRLYLSAVGVATIFVVALAYLFSAVLDQPLLSRPDQVTVELTATGGLFEGSAVTYRGVKVGKVTDIAMAGEGVEATISLTGGRDIPLDSVARVRSLSPVGEQYLDLQPNTDDGPYLADGATIPAESTDLPKSLSSTVIAVNDVLRQIDDKALRTVLKELSTGLAGTGEDLRRLVDQTDLLLTDLDAIWPETERLLTNGDRVLDIGLDQAGDIEDLATSSRQLAAFLKEYDPRLRRTLKRAPGQMQQLEDLVAEAGEVLPEFLTAGVSLTDLFVDRDPHLRRLLQVYAVGLGSLVDQMREGRLFIEILGQKDLRCSYDTPRRAPKDPRRRAMVRDQRCDAGFSRLQRGAAHAPGPIR
ncbi:MCE family protein [Nocardioides sp.]|uniref:MCE family protein n=1 Tax=Nocardioides sp. TaxID=35761 RepID=UPI00273309FF|nr:MlaD family protein [Nocardioides sp.]MDP3892726.1 MlaD family protein [Nocardioides sp.]